MLPEKFRTLASVALLATAVMVQSTDAYSVVPSRKTRESTKSSSAIGYTMEIPDLSAGLPKSTWYDVANPTARRIVYDDDPSEFTFATIGSNWPDLNEDAEDDEFTSERAPSRARQTLSRINPIRHAKNLIRWIL